MMSRAWGRWETPLAKPLFRKFDIDKRFGKTLFAEVYYISKDCPLQKTLVLTISKKHFRVSKIILLRPHKCLKNPFSSTEDSSELDTLFHRICRCKKIKCIENSILLKIVFICRKICRFGKKNL